MFPFVTLLMVHMLGMIRTRLLIGRQLRLSLMLSMLVLTVLAPGAWFAVMSNSVLCISRRLMAMANLDLLRAIPEVNRLARTARFLVSRMLVMTREVLGLLGGRT